MSDLIFSHYENDRSHFHIFIIRVCAQKINSKI